MIDTSLSWNSWAYCKEYISDLYIEHWSVPFATIPLLNYIVTECVYVFFSLCVRQGGKMREKIGKFLSEKKVRVK